jgi:hypothetical protein
MVDGGGRTSGARGWWVYVPALWLAANVLLATRQLFVSWWMVGATGLPRAVAVVVHGGAVAALVTLLWGLLVLRLAWTRSPRFPRAFLVWQTALLLQAFVLLTPDFAFSPSSLATAALEVAVGIFCIVVASRADGQPSAPPPVPVAAAPASAVATVLAALLGLVAGAALGFGGGLFGGALFAQATDMSCFEGACGFFAFFIGLAGLAVGALAGLMLGVWLVRRRRRAAPAA